MGRLVLAAFAVAAALDPAAPSAPSALRSTGELNAALSRGEYDQGSEDDPEADPEATGEAAAAAAIGLCDLPADWPSTSDEDVLTAYFDCLSTQCHDVDARIFDDSGDIGCADIVASGVHCYTTVPGSPFPLSFLCPAICGECANALGPTEITGEDYLEAASANVTPAFDDDAEVTAQDYLEAAGANMAPDTADDTEVRDWPFQVAPAAVVAPHENAMVDDENTTVDDEDDEAEDEDADGEAANVTQADVDEGIDENADEHADEDIDDEGNVTSADEGDIADVSEEVPLLTLEFARAPPGRVAGENAGGLSTYQGVAGVVRCGEEEHRVLVYLADSRAPPQDAEVYSCAGTCGEQEWSDPMKINRIDCGPLSNGAFEARRAFMTRATLVA